jgi:hypothetical protein
MLAVEKNNCLTLFESAHFCVKPHSYQLLSLTKIQLKLYAFEH